VVRVASCDKSGMAASPKSKNWPISEAAGVAMLMECHLGLLDAWSIVHSASRGNDKHAFRQSMDEQ
jgi:hypothetical protein